MVKHTLCLRIWKLRSYNSVSFLLYAYKSMFLVIRLWYIFYYVLFLFICIDIFCLKYYWVTISLKHLFLVELHEMSFSSFSFLLFRIVIFWYLSYSYFIVRFFLKIQSDKSVSYARVKCITFIFISFVFGILSTSLFYFVVAVGQLFFLFRHTFSLCVAALIYIIISPSAS